MTDAISCTLKYEIPLQRYCEDGRLAIDNNECERALRLAAIGRKNWMFFGNDRGGHTGAILYTILSSARRAGLNEYEYLMDILNRLCDLNSTAEIADLLPDQWKKWNP
ncbi:hypothetical protein FACS189427_07910 [Planctomycetales bacterium]|nr:hypothetical protein FACS189427_07910 [Planctomycetales bacterium]